MTGPDGDAWQGLLRVAPGCAVFIGPAGDTDIHRHQALQLSVGLDGPLSIRSGPTVQSCAGVVVAPNAPHAIDGRGRSLGLFYAERSSPEGAAWSRAVRFSGLRLLDPDVVEALRAPFERLARNPADDSLAFLRAALVQAAPDPAPPPAPASPLVARAIQRLESQVPGSIRVAELATELGARQRDLSRAFRDETSLSVRAYVLWLRIQRAVAALAEGDNLTGAAHAAGFADAGHLSRVFRRMFGVAPSTGIGRSRIMKGDPAQPPRRKGSTS